MRKSRSNIIAIALIIVAIILVVVTVFIARQIATRDVNPDDTDAAIRNVRSTKVKDLPVKRSGRLNVLAATNVLAAAVASDASSGVSIYNGTSWTNTATIQNCTDTIDTDDNRNFTPQRVTGRISADLSNNADIILSGWTWGYVAAINSTTGACSSIDDRAVIYGDHFETSYGIASYVFPNSGGTAYYASTGGRRGTEPSFRSINVANRTDGTSTNGQALKRSQVEEQYCPYKAKS